MVRIHAGQLTFRLRRIFYLPPLWGTKKPDRRNRPGFKVRLNYPDKSGNPPPVTLLALADGGGSWGLLAGASAEGQGSCRESDDCCDLGDGHGKFRLLSVLVA